MTKSETIQNISREGIKTIPDCDLDIKDSEDLRDYLLNANNSEDVFLATTQAEGVFCDFLETSPSEKDVLRTFLNGWQATHSTALYVSGLIVRILRESRHALQENEPSKALLLNEAAFHMGEIIAEDTGAVGLPHAVMYERFARTLTGDDSWKMQEHHIPECDDFRAYVARARLRDPIETAILTTAASENWNTGEYTYFAPRVLDWMTSHDVPNPVRSAAYVSVHAGTTELDHFTHALKAWQLYHEAHGTEARPEKAANIFKAYAREAHSAFSALGACFDRARPVMTPDFQRAFRCA